MLKNVYNKINNTIIDTLNSLKYENYKKYQEKDSKDLLFSLPSIKEDKELETILAVLTERYRKRFLSDIKNEEEINRKIAIFIDDIEKYDKFINENYKENMNEDEIWEVYEKALDYLNNYIEMFK